MRIIITGDYLTFWIVCYLRFLLCNPFIAMAANEEHFLSDSFKEQCTHPYESTTRSVSHCDNITITLT